MLTKLRKQAKGFTIIEVLIVLAIAALILLIVFLAVPALQRNSRNTRRTDDAAKAAGIVQEAINNNNGSAPTTTPTIIMPANAQYGIISNVDYNVSSTSFQALPATLAQDTLYIRNYALCFGPIAVTGGTQRQMTVSYIVESPGTATAGPIPAGQTGRCQSI